MNVEREIRSTDLPCTCGATFGEHEYAKMKYTCERTGCTSFTHAETPPIEPQENSKVGHHYGGYDGVMYRIARVVLYPHMSPVGIDYEIEPLEGDLSRRRLVSGRAIGASYHHAAKCPCMTVPTRTFG